MFRLHPTLKEDTFFLGQFPLCQLLLMNDSNYPWFILVPQVNEIREIFQLDEQAQTQLLRESTQISKIINDVFNADKINVAALGNVVPQLHIHHIVRYKNDPAWPAPVWGKYPAQAYNESNRTKIVEQLQATLPANFTWNSF